MLTGEDMSLIDLVFTRSAFKVTKFTFVKKVEQLPLHILRTIAYRPFILHMLIGPSKGMTSIHFVLTRSKAKVTVVIFLNM